MATSVLSFQRVCSTQAHPTPFLTYLQAWLQPLTYIKGNFSTLASLKNAYICFIQVLCICFASGIEREKAYLEKVHKNSITREKPIIKGRQI